MRQGVNVIVVIPYSDKPKHCFKQKKIDFNPINTCVYGSKITNFYILLDKIIKNEEFTTG